MWILGAQLLSTVYSGVRPMVLYNMQYARCVCCQEAPGEGSKFLLGASSAGHRASKAATGSWSLVLDRVLYYIICSEPLKLAGWRTSYVRKSREIRLGALTRSKCKWKRSTRLEVLESFEMDQALILLWFRWYSTPVVYGKPFGRCAEPYPLRVLLSSLYLSAN